MIKPSEARALVEEAQRDPVRWIEAALGVKLWAKQRAIIESVRDNPEASVSSCHGSGKSFVAACLSLWWLYCHSPSIVLTTAPTDRQVKKILWKEIATLHRGAVKRLDGQLLTQELKIAPDWFAMGFTSRDYDPERFQGFHAPHLLVVVDEASGVTQDIQDGIDGVTSTGHARKLSISNPTDPMSPFASDFKRPNVAKHYIDAFGTPNFTAFGITEQDIIDDTWRAKIDGPLPYPDLIGPEWVARMLRKWGHDSPLWQIKVKGRFPEVGSDAFFSPALIQAAQDRELERGPATRVAADIARYGADKTVTGCRWGPVARILIETAKESLMQTTGRIVRAVDETEAPEAAVDDDGLGGGVTDRLEELSKDPNSPMHGVTVIPLRGGTTPKDAEHYLNARCEWYGALLDRMRSGDLDIDPDDDELEAQLVNIKYKIDSRGRIVIEPKAEMKKRGLPSPDRADWLVYQFAQTGPAPIGDIQIPMDVGKRSSPWNM